MNVLVTPEFDEWFSGQDIHSRGQIEDRFDRIREHSHFGDRKYLGNDLFELRWKNGRRIYYGLLGDSEGPIAFMLLGGSKNGQARDIARAYKILERTTT